MKSIIFLVLIFLSFNVLHAQDTLRNYPVRGFCIAAPRTAEVDRFVKFIREELVPARVNTLILRVDYNFQYKSRPELAEPGGLSLADVKKIVLACKEGSISVIPQINLLGHQSWAGTTNNLLRKYPQFDETPHVKMPAEYKWPNADSLYCKSYCPLHPDVHGIVFPMVDEICEAFESTAFHAGLDEVFYIGDDKCPRCKGKDKAVLFAGEVRRIRDHLAGSNRKLWMWGDRLLDGYTTGIGMWEASTNGTHPAIDLIPRDVVICDWHYERADKSAVYFAMKGLDVLTCPWRNPALAIKQSQDMQDFREESTAKTRSHLRGIVQTVWSSAGQFLDGYYQDKKDDKGGDQTPWHCFRALAATWKGDNKN